MKWHQTSPASESSLPTADISWIELGHATDHEIERWPDGITFADIFDTATAESDGSCPDGFTGINANGVGEECLALKSRPREGSGLPRVAALRGVPRRHHRAAQRRGHHLRRAHESPVRRVQRDPVRHGRQQEERRAPTPTTTTARATTSRCGFNSCGGVYAFDVGRDAAIGSRYVAKRVNGRDRRAA